MTPFECDLCIFRKLTQRNPDPGNHQDRLLNACIRRVNLDALWSRAPTTVKGNTDRLKLGIKLSKMVGLEGPYVHMGPLPDFDHCGYEVAIQIVLHSRSPGRNNADHLQFDTVRTLRAAYSNQCRASPQATTFALAMGNEKGQYDRFSTDASGSLWFTRFIQGCRHRMGQEWRPNKAFSMPLLHRLLQEVEARIEGASSSAELHMWIVFHCYAVVTYVVSLRGTEGLLLDLAGLRRHMNEGQGRFVVLALLGKVKGEHGDRAHLLPAAERTGSGIGVRETVMRLIAIKQQRGFVDGPAVSSENGRAYSSRDIDDLMHEVLEDIFEREPDLFPSDIKTMDQVRQSYHAFRTFRRTSTTRATEKGVSENDVDTVNRWHQVEASAGSRPARAMRQHYVQLELLEGPFMRYTQAM